MTTIPADYIFMFLIGALFAGVNIEPVRKGGHILLNRYFLTALLYQTIFCMPLAIYCYIVFPDWCWMYWADSERAPAIALFTAFAGYYFLNAAGFALTSYLAGIKRGAALKIIRWTILFFVLFSIINYRRLFYVGSIEEFQNGTIPLLFQRVSLFMIVSAGILVGLTALVNLLSKFGEKLDRHWDFECQKGLDRKKKIVSIARLGGSIEDTILSSLEQWDGISYIREHLKVKQNRVIIKPNYCGGGKDKRGTQTSPEVLSALIDILRDIDENVDIKVVESGSIFWWKLKKVYDGSYHQKVIDEKRVKFLDLSRERCVEHDFGGRLGSEQIPCLLLEKHFFIDLPVAKTHSFYVMSGALKNLFGLLPVAFKLDRYHSKGFGDRQGRIFIDIYRSFQPDLVIVDGIVGCEGDGPFGTPKETGFIISSDDAICADFVLAQIMHLQPRQIPYLRALINDGIRCDYRVVGEQIESVRPAFWKPARRFPGLLLNVFRICVEHLRLI